MTDLIARLTNPMKTVEGATVIFHEPDITAILHALKVQEAAEAYVNTGDANLREYMNAKANLWRAVKGEQP